MTKTNQKIQETLRPVLDWLENGAPHIKSTKNKNIKITFDMNSFENDEGECGTACCIAGAAYQFSSDMRKELPGVDTRDACNSCYSVGQWLGLSEEDSKELFLPSGLYVHYGDISAAQAAETLRHFLDTGEIVWDQSLYW